MNVAPEFSLLCLAARPGAYGDMEALRSAIAATPDWQAVIEGARRNRVTSLVLASLQACGSSHIPPDVLAELHRQTVGSVGRSLAKIPAIEHLSATFDQAKIRFLIVKGIPLSLQLYGDATRRTADDIDVLVSPDQFWQAGEVLTQSGYRCETEIRPGALRARFVHWAKDLRYTSERFRTVVELHHRLTANPYLLDWTFDALWNDRVQVRVGETEIATLPGGKLPLYLFIHGASHGWERLRWLVDLTTVLQSPGAVERLLGDAERAGLRPAALQSLALAHAWLGLPFSPEYLEQAGKNPKVKRLDFCLSRFLGRATWRHRPLSNSLEWFWRYSIWFSLYGLSLKADWRYRAYQCAAVWVHPPDWDVVHLPAALFWLYPLIRPYGWIRRRLGW